MRACRYAGDDCSYCGVGYARNGNACELETSALVDGTETPDEPSPAGYGGYGGYGGSEPTPLPGGYGGLTPVPPPGSGNEPPAPTRGVRTCVCWSLRRETASGEHLCGS